METVAGIARFWGALLNGNPLLPFWLVSVSLFSLVANNNGRRRIR
jgi:hypothetical protein